MLSNHRESKYNYLDGAFSQELDNQNRNLLRNVGNSKNSYINKNEKSDKNVRNKKNVKKNKRQVNIDHSHHHDSPISFSSPKNRCLSSQIKNKNDVEFSPYENGNNIKQLMQIQTMQQLQCQNSQLLCQNCELSTQLQHSQETVLSLSTLLQHKETEVHELRELSRTLTHKHQQMQQEIVVLLQKNCYLEEKIVLLEKQLLAVERLRRQNQIKTINKKSQSIDDYRNGSVDNFETTNFDLKNRSFSIENTNKDTHKDFIIELLDILESKNFLPKSKVSSKRQSKSNSRYRSNSPIFLNKTMQNVKSSEISPKKNPKLKIHQIITEKIESLMQNVSKYEQFIESVIEMHNKIEKKPFKNGNTLKYLWKWLKQLGHSYNCSQKWRKFYMELLKIPQNSDISMDQLMSKVADYVRIQ